MSTFLSKFVNIITQVRTQFSTLCTRAERPGFCSSTGTANTRFLSIFRLFQGHRTTGKKSLCICLSWINSPSGQLCRRCRLEQLKKKKMVTKGVEHVFVACRKFTCFESNFLFFYFSVMEFFVHILYLDRNYEYL